ncbi:QRFP-like peptide receptor [Pocillopora verrucosa]|uniref:QRFP-like peptide receptor n=1 Tax=Pocillopora verrucosa TaxID=203993 RepID=UPI0027976F12|nr:QRFP-like peptide receptor [Pocillopora verrucosa]
MSVAFAITTTLFILVLVDIVGNSLVCVIIWKNRNLRTPINVLIFNLAVADALFAAFISPKLIVGANLRHPEGWISSILCTFITGGGFGWVAAACSIYTLVAIAVERYYAVFDPRGKRWKLTNRKLKVIITIAWLIGVTSNIPTFIHLKVTNGLCYETWPDDWKIRTYNIFLTTQVCVALSVMVTLYSRVVFALWFKRNGTNAVTPQQKGIMGVRKRVTIMAVVVSIIFGICHGSIQFFYTLHLFTSYQMSYAVYAFSNLMILFNSAVNPFVYALLNHNFREKVKAILRCSKVKVDATS